MARSCGMRIGPRRYELVVLEGSAKKPKITAWAAGELPSLEVDFDEAVAVLREVVKEHDVPRDNVGLAIDTGLAAFRSLRMPFAERGKIEEVLKYEVEGQLSQWSIDDVVIDFLTLEETREASELLVTAVPKAPLKRLISLCEKAGVEPQECELETTAMVNAALGAELCPPDSAQVLVHVGEYTTSVVVVDGGRVREMRAIHIGALSHLVVLEAGRAAEEGEAAASAEPLAEGAEAPPTEGLEIHLPEIDPLEAQVRFEQSIKRIRRELGRTLSAARTAHPIDSVHLCGLELPGLVGSSVLDVPVRALEVFQEDGGQPAEGSGPLVVAYGVALRHLGGGLLRPSLRREDLRYAGALEKLELPLAVLALLVVTLLGVWNIFLYREYQSLDERMLTWRDSAKNFLVGTMRTSGYLESPPESVANYVKSLDSDEERTKYEQLKRIEFLLGNENRALEKQLGQDAEVRQPQSALRALAAVLDVFEHNKDRVGRPSFRKFTAQQRAARGQQNPEHVEVSMDLVFFADSALAATQNYEEGFLREVEAQPWFVDLKRPQSETLEDGNGIYLQGLVIRVDVDKIPATPAEG